MTTAPRRKEGHGSSRPPSVTFSHQARATFGSVAASCMILSRHAGSAAAWLNGPSPIQKRTVSSSGARSISFKTMRKCSSSLKQSVLPS